MDEMVIYDAIKQALPAIIGGSATALASSFIGIRFLRQKTMIEEIEKLKAGLWDDVIRDMLQSGELSYVDLYHSQNLLSIAKKADKISQHESKNQKRKGASGKQKSKDFSFDWFMRFFESAKNISEEDLQNYWAKVLANEIHEPGRVSLKALGILINLDMNDAKAFDSLCQSVVVKIEDGQLSEFSFSTFITASSTPVFLRCPTVKHACDGQCISPPSSILEWDAIALRMQGAGVLEHSETKFVYESQPAPQKPIIFCNNNLALFLKIAPDTVLEFSAYYLTWAGLELFKILYDRKAADDIFLLHLGANLHNTVGVRAKIHPIKDKRSGYQFLVDGEIDYIKDMIKGRDCDKILTNAFSKS